jgi:hypothetical protein
MKDHDFLFHICTKKKSFLTILDIVDIIWLPSLSNMKIRWDIKVSHKVGQIWHGKPMFAQFTRQNCKDGIKNQHMGPTQKCTWTF